MTELHAFALVVIQHPATGKFVLINETRNRGWWLPGGHVESGESFEIAAVREAKEEAGIDVVLTGVLRVEYTPHIRTARMRVIFLARPADLNAPLKSVADSESLEAHWVTHADLATYARRGNGLRGDEPSVWFAYVERKGFVAPMSMMTQEGDQPSADLFAPSDA